MNTLKKLFKRYNYINFVIFILLSLILLFLLHLSSKAQTQNEFIHLQSRFKIQAENIDFFLKEISSYVTELRNHAQDDLMYISVENKNRNIMFQQITDSDDKTYFHLDSFADIVSKDMIGNLTGIVSFQNHEPDFYDEINMALNLNGMLRFSFHTLEIAPWVYYTSKNRFISIYPRFCPKSSDIRMKC